MRFRLGYVAMTLNLEDCSPSGTVTVSTLEKLGDEKARLYRLRKVASKNIANTMRILRYNKAYNIKVYRFTSKLIPLATHPMVRGWNYAEEFKKELKEIGDFVKENDIRVSAHPDHYTVINTNSPKVFNDSVLDLEYHVEIFKAMGLDDYKYKLVLHTGGLYKDKIASIERFKENFIKLPKSIANRIILENDDKSFTAADVLGICKDLKIPMVLDVHHHYCNNGGEQLDDMLEDIFETWQQEYFNPKVHFSTPKSEKDYRSHADDINAEEFMKFISSASYINQDIDVMLEAKNKDSALLKLSDELTGYGNVKRINEAEFEIL